MQTYKFNASINLAGKKCGNSFAKWKFRFAVFYKFNYFVHEIGKSLLAFCAHCINNNFQEHNRKLTIPNTLTQKHILALAQREFCEKKERKLLALLSLLLSFFLKHSTKLFQIQFVFLRLAFSVLFVFPLFNWINIPFTSRYKNTIVTRREKRFFFSCYKVPSDFTLSVISLFS